MLRTVFRRKRALASLILVALLLLGSLILANSSPYHLSSDNTNLGFNTQDKIQPQDQYVYTRATVLSVHDETSAGNKGTQNVSARLNDGPQKGQIVSVERYGTSFNDPDYRRLPIGSKILLFKNYGSGNAYTFVDRYRLPGAATLFIILLLLTVVIARWRGIGSIAGLAISVIILALFVIPRIAHGHDAYVTCVEGAFIIATASMFLAHGFNRRAAVAFAGVILTLTLTVGITAFSRYLTGLTGFQGEDSLGIAFAKQYISLSGILFGGIIIASLGVLNDITIGQAAAVEEIYKADTRQSASKLYQRGMSVGREHVAALINTLALAYVAVALPAVITTALYNHAPLLVVLNNESVMEEVVRTAVVSISLLLAVPITTLLAVYILPRWTADTSKKVKGWLSEL